MELATVKPLEPERPAVTLSVPRVDAMPRGRALRPRSAWVRGGKVTISFRQMPEFLQESAEVAEDRPEWR